MRTASDLLRTPWLTSWSSKILTVLAGRLPACHSLCQPGLCYGVSPCYGVGPCYGVIPYYVSLCCLYYGVSLCHSVRPCYGVSLCYAVIITMCCCFCCVRVLVYVLWSYGVRLCYGVNGYYGVIPFYCVNPLWMEACRLEVGAWRSPRLLLIVVRGALPTNLYLFLKKIQNSGTPPPPNLNLDAPYFSALKKFWIMV